MKSSEKMIQSNDVSLNIILVYMHRSWDTIASCFHYELIVMNLGALIHHNLRIAPVQKYVGFAHPDYR
jgi:hypothetical protein